MGSKADRFVFAIASRDRLAYARVLFDSVRRHLPAFVPLLVMAEHAPLPFDPRDEPFEIVLADELGIESFSTMAARRSAFELSCALKPFVAQRLLARGAQRLVYLDTDMLLLRPAHGLDQMLDAHELILTPHLLASVDGAAAREAEDRVLPRGVFNGGFFALRSSPAARAFLNWWATRLATECLVDLPRSRYVDQRWLDLVPGLVEGFRPLRHFGYNVAYWNLHERPLRELGGEIYAGPDPLTLFHFSGFDPDRPGDLSRHSKPYRELTSEDALGRLTHGYAESLWAHGLAESRAWKAETGPSTGGGARVPGPGSASSRLRAWSRRRIPRWLRRGIRRLLATRGAGRPPR